MNERVVSTLSEYKRIVNETPFPENPSERMGALLTSFNTAPKTAIFLFIPSNSGISEKELNSKFFEVSKGSLMEDRHVTGNTSAIRTLANNGLVYEYYDSNIKRLIARTQAGTQYGIPAAYLTLDFEMRNKQSVREIIGKTGGTNVEINSQLMRAKILTYLRSQDTSLRRKDISQALDIDEERVGSVLQDLSETGTVEYTFAEKSGKSVVLYTPNPDFTQDPNELLTGKGKQYILSVCQSIINSGEELTTERIRKNLSQEFLLSWKSNRALKNYISSILSILTRNGFLVKKYFRDERYSDAKITDKGILFVDEYLTPLEAIANDVPEIRDKLASEIIPRVSSSLKKHIKHSINFYYPHSSSYMHSAEQANYENVFRMLGNSRNSCSISDIAKALGLNRATVADIVEKFGNIFKLKKELRGKVFYYQLDRKRSHRTFYDDKDSLETARKISGLKISKDDKEKLMAYALWTQCGSVSDVASRLNISQPNVWQAIEDVNNSEGLIRLLSVVIDPEDN